MEPKEEEKEERRLEARILEIYLRGKRGRG
jgi:hypothetical protein